MHKRVLRRPSTIKVLQEAQTSSYVNKHTQHSANAIMPQPTTQTMSILEFVILFVLSVVIDLLSPQISRRHCHPVGLVVFIVRLFLWTNSLAASGFPFASTAAKFLLPWNVRKGVYVCLTCDVACRLVVYANILDADENICGLDAQLREGEHHASRVLAEAKEEKANGEESLGRVGSSLAQAMEGSQCSEMTGVGVDKKNLSVSRKRRRRAILGFEGE